VALKPLRALLASSLLSVRAEETRKSVPISAAKKICKQARCCQNPDQIRQPADPGIQGLTARTRIRGARLRRADT